MLQRILLIVLVLLVAWRLLVAAGRRVARRGFGADSYSRFSHDRTRRRREWADRGPGDRPDELVPCHRCGTYIPSRRALTSGTGDVFCGPECRDRAEASSDHAS